MRPESDFSHDLCDALRVVLHDARLSAGLSLGEVAAKAGLNRQAVTFIEKGERRPTAETFVRLVVALGLRPSEAWLRAESALPSTRMKMLPPNPGGE